MSKPPALARLALAALFLVPIAVPAAPGAPVAPVAPVAPAGEYAWEPPDTLHPGWYARLETSLGPILIRLLPEQAPQSVAHFVAIARGELGWDDIITGKPVKERYFDGTVVNKALAGRQFEAGERSGTGKAAPSIYVPFDEGRGPVNFNVGGRLGLTRASGRRISAVQFFVTASAQPWLSGHYPCIGVVVEGSDVAMRISNVKTYPNGRPLEDVTVERVRIFSIGEVEPLEQPVPHQPAPLEMHPRKKNGDAVSSVP